MRTVYINSTVIFYPRIDLEYVIKIPGLKNVKVRFQGQGVEDVIKFDVSTAIYVAQNYTGDQVGGINYTEFEGITLIPREAMPPNLEHMIRSPINIIEQEDQNTLIEVEDITFIRQEKDFGLEFEAREAVELKQFQVEQKFQKWLGINSGRFYIFDGGAYPSLEVLEKIFGGYFQFNGRDKVREQLENTLNLCHVRSHFLSILLRMYGIPSYHLFKRMNPDDWTQFKVKHSYWHFHAATVVIDSDGRSWVVDPWVFGNEMLSVERWARHLEHPKPTSLTLSSHVVVSDLKGSMPDSVNFNVMTSGDNVDAVQFLIQSAIPNPPKKYLRDTEKAGSFEKLP